MTTVSSRELNSRDWDKGSYDFVPGQRLSQQKFQWTEGDGAIVYKNYTVKEISAELGKSVRDLQAQHKEDKDTIKESIQLMLGENIKVETLEEWNKINQVLDTNYTIEEKNLFDKYRKAYNFSILKKVLFMIRNRLSDLQNGTKGKKKLPLDTQMQKKLNQLNDEKKQLTVETNNAQKVFMKKAKALHKKEKQITLLMAKAEAEAAELEDTESFEKDLTKEKMNRLESENVGYKNKLIELLGEKEFEKIFMPQQQPQIKHEGN